VRAQLLLLIALASSSASASPLDGADQLIVARAASWKAREGTLRRYVRQDGQWVEAGDAIPVAFGSKGLAWGRGIAPLTPDAPPAPGPAKREGDARTPAGVFHLTAITGEAAAPPPGARLPYTRATERLVCVDDGRSRHYNRITERGSAPDWTSSEPMLLPPLYAWTVFVDHNPTQTPGGGSCIFLHVWRKPGGATLGCTAMERRELEALLAWLDPQASPRYVVLPDAAYRALRGAWKLP
jgi:hypothetical protein